MQPPELSQRLAAFSINLKIDEVPENAVANAKLAVLDCFGVSILAASQEAGRALLRLAETREMAWAVQCLGFGDLR